MRRLNALLVAVVVLPCVVSATEGRRKPTTPTDVYGRELVRNGERVTHGEPGPQEQAAAAETLAAESAVAAVGGGADASTPNPVPGAFGLRWRLSTLGVGLGAEGLFVGDVDADGTPEIVLSGVEGSTFGGANAWSILRPAGAGYEVAWSSAPTPYLGALTVAQMDGDPALEILVAAGGRVSVFDGASRLVQRSFAAADVTSMVVADVDGDGAREVVTVGSSGLGVFDGTGAVEWSAPQYPGVDVAVGNVDGDAAPEILVANNSGNGYVLDGVTHAVEWTNEFGFGAFVRAGDLDGDGVEEIVAAQAWYVIRVFDARAKTLVRTIEADLDIDALQVLDVEGDGPVEIVYGDGQWGSVYVLDGAGVLKWSLPNPEHGVTNVAVGDADGDGKREIVWGAGYSSTGADYLYVHAIDGDRAREWRSTDYDPPFLAAAGGDVDADGEPEIAYMSASSESYYDDGVLFVQDAETRQTEYTHGPVVGVGYSDNRVVLTANVDSDPALEILFAIDTGYTGRMVALDGATRTEQWRSAGVASGLSIAAAALGDVDGDGTLEIVAATDVEHTGASGAKVFVIDAATGAIEWSSPQLTTGFDDLTGVAIGNVDGDGAVEIVARSASGRLYVIDGVTRQAATLPVTGVSAFDLADTEGDGRAELYVASAGTVSQRDAVTGTLVRTLRSGLGTVSTLEAADADGDGVPEIFFADADELYAVRRDGEVFWSAAVADVRRLTLEDFDADGFLEIWAARSADVLLYEVNLAEVDVRASLTPSRATAGLGEEIELALGATNAGTSPAHEVTFSLLVGAGLEVTSSDGCEAGALVVTCPLGDLAPAATATRTVTARIVSDASDIVSTLTVSSSDPDRTPGDNVATATVRVPPHVVAADVSVVEGYMTSVVLSLSHATSSPVTVDWTTAPGTALAGADFVAASGTVTIPAGSTAGVLNVATVNDQVQEPLEAFVVGLSNVSGATLPDAVVAVTIEDNDGARTLSVAGGGRVDEPVAAREIVVTLSGPREVAVTVAYRTVDRTAVAGRDYTARSGTLTFAPGQVRHTIAVPLLNDPWDENDEAFDVVLSSPTRATIATSTTRVEIVDDDAAPYLQVRGAVVAERNGEPSAILVPVALSAPSGKRVTVAWTTADGNARAGTDYRAASGTVVLEPGVRLANIAVVLIHDRVPELDESFQIWVQAASNVSGTVVTDHVHVLDDDNRP